jgi:predicted alpha/beta superfamily hydrolase
MIMIGVANKDRCRDMLPVKVEEYPTSGGADKFLTFMAEELIPFVDRNFRTTDFRILYGESDAGLFTVYALFTQPEAFSAYIASNPSLGWCPGVISEKGWFLHGTRWSKSSTYFIISGSGEYKKQTEPLQTTPG